MDGVEVLAFLSLILLLTAAGLVIALDLGRASGRGARLATWAALTALALWVGFVVAFLFCYGVLFALGTGMAAVAFVACAVILGAMPFATGFIVRRISHGPSH